MVEVGAHLPDAGLDPRKVAVELVVPELQLVKGGAVDVVGVAVDGGQTTREKHLLQAFGEHRGVGGDAETTETLAEQRPRVHPKSTAESLAISDDGIGPKQGVTLGRQHVHFVHPPRTPRAALVQQQHPVMLQELPEPAACRCRPG